MKTGFWLSNPIADWKQLVIGHSRWKNLISCPVCDPADNQVLTHSGTTPVTGCTWAINGLLATTGTFSHTVKVERKKTLEPIAGHNEHCGRIWWMYDCRAQGAKGKLIIFNGILSEGKTAGDKPQYYLSWLQTRELILKNALAMFWGFFFIFGSATGRKIKVCLKIHFLWVLKKKPGFY